MISTNGDSLAVEKPFRFPYLQLRRTMRRSFSAFATKVHCPFVNARYTVRRAAYVAISSRCTPCWCSNAVARLYLLKTAPRHCERRFSQQGVLREKRHDTRRRSAIHRSRKKRNAIETNWIFLSEIFFRPFPPFQIRRFEQRKKKRKKARTPPTIKFSHDLIRVPSVCL